MERSSGFSAIQFIGTQRSGSNLLRVMLNQLPEISAPHPPHILKTFFPLLEHYGDLRIDGNFFLLLSDICEWVNLNPVPWEGVHFNPIQLSKMCDQRNLVEIFRRIHEIKAQYDGARYWCCKSMESVYYTHGIEDAGIHPVYIFIYRDGRDVALSFLKAIVGPKHIYHLARKWKKEQELSLKLKAELPRERFISVKYEELIARPENVMQGICSQLNITYRESVMDYFHSRESVNTASSGTMWKNVIKPILRNNHHKYLKELTQEQIQIFEFVARDILLELGYTLFESPSAFSFHKSDIEKFDLENQETIKKSLQLADIEDIAKRKPQEDLLIRIKRRTQT